MPSSSNKKQKEIKGAGHRERLRKRFLQGGLDALLDYEIIELLLTLGTPRRDCKSIAKVVMKKFKNLKNALDASPEELQEIKGIGPNNFFGIKLFQAISERYAKERILDRIKFYSPANVALYLHKLIGRKKRESFVSLLLDSNNHLIKDCAISVGTLNESLVHPREVFKPAIKFLAAGIIIAHNHPSGNLEPSVEDVTITKRLASVGELAGIKLVDHIIISSSGYTSFKEKGLL